MSNLWSLHRQYEQLFRHTVKDLRRERIPLQHLCCGIFYFNLAGPHVAKIHTEASHLFSCTVSLPKFITTTLHLGNSFLKWAHGAHIVKRVIHAREETLEDGWRASFQWLALFPLSPSTPQQRFISSCYMSLLLEASERLDPGFSLLRSTEVVSVQV